MSQSSIRLHFSVTVKPFHVILAITGFHKAWFWAFQLALEHPEPSFMEACDCNGACTASWCTCQDDLEILDEDSLNTFVYDANVEYFVIKSCLIQPLNTCYL